MSLSVAGRDDVEGAQQGAEQVPVHRDKSPRPNGHQDQGIPLMLADPNLNGRSKPQQPAAAFLFCYPSRSTS